MTRPFSNSRRTVLRQAGAGFAASLPGLPLWAADTYPDGPVRVLVGTPAGGPPDTNTRAFAEVLGGKLKQPFVVENKVGANGTLAFQAAQSAPPDGKTLCYFSQYNLYSMALMDKLSLLDGFDCVTQISEAPSILVVGAQSPYTSLAQLLEAARKSPGDLTYSSGGMGSPGNIGMEMLKHAAKIDMRHIPFKGGGEQTQAIIGGSIDSGLVLMGVARGLLESKRLRALAVTTSRRLPELPDVPTVSEAGVANYSLTTWGGYVVRKGTGKSIIDALFRQIGAAAKDPRVVTAMQRSGSTLQLSKSPEEFARFYASERVASLALLKQIGMIK